MAARRRRTAPLDAPTQTRVDATVAAYQAYYGQYGAPHPVTFPSDDELERERAEVRAIVEADREVYDGPLKARQAELAKKRDLDRLPYRLIASYGKLDEDEVRACLGVAGARYDEYDRDRSGGVLHNRDSEAWHWSRTERFREPDPNAVFMQVAEAISPEAVAMIRRAPREPRDALERRARASRDGAHQGEMTDGPAFRRWSAVHRPRGVLAPGGEIFRPWVLAFSHESRLGRLTPLCRRGVDARIPTPERVCIRNFFSWEEAF